MRIELCGDAKATVVFHHYEYGDPLPVYARYYGQLGEPVSGVEALSVYVKCEREAGHDGVHLARGIGAWT